MKIPQITPITWRRLLITILIVAAASAIRMAFFAGLGRGIAYLTFYPAVMVVAIYGGFYGGMLATIISALLCYFWVQQGYLSNVEWLAMCVFILSSTLISSIAEAMRHANRKAKEAQQQAQIANKAKSSFLANMSHELRTPLNAILGYSYLMKRDAALTTGNHEYCDIINQSGEHLLALINDVLEISKIDAKSVTIEASNFDLHSLILNLKKMFELKTKEKGILFEMCGVDALPRFIMADEVKIKSILINLIGNAVKFTEKGSVIVRFSFQKESLPETNLWIEVEDTGAGIAEDEQDKLFKFFVQTDSGQMSKSGTGLGLAISQNYAKMMGGEITVESCAGKGSKFTLSLKIEEGAEENQTTKMQQQRIVGLAKNQNIPRILVAEDRIENRQLLVNLLKLIGFDVHEAANGKEAVEIVEQWSPHLIWMDIRMPVMDGLEATRIIKATPQGKKTIIVAISAHILGEERKAILAAGCDDFVGKPFKENEIFDALGKHLACKYIYEDLPEEAAKIIIHSDMALDLSSLGIAIISEIKKAAILTDALKITEIAKRIKVQEPEIAEVLLQCAKKYDYETILIAIRENSKEGGIE